MKRLFVISTIILILVSCASINKMNKLSLGMTKQEVIDAIGEPDSTSAQGNQEDLTYIEKAVDPNTWMYIMVPCSVRLINGIVQSYGKAGDYERASQPARKYDINVHNK